MIDLIRYFFSTIIASPLSSMEMAAQPPPKLLFATANFDTWKVLC